MPFPDPSSSVYTADATAGQKYPLLRRLVGILKVYGYFCILVAVVVPLYLWLTAEGRMAEAMAVSTGLTVFFLGMAQGVAFLTMSEVPQVFMDTEQNTREAAELLRTMQSQK